jgi:N-acetylglucosaminyldiphosphoundecaprenol N-acetyl-beta-D-mannosaminyltransferase
MPSTKRYNILGVQVDALTNREAIDHIVRRATDTSRPSCYIVKPYVEFFDAVHRGKATAALLNNAELCLADSVAVQWAALYLYGGKHSLPRLISTLAHIMLRNEEMTKVLPERAAGISFTWPMLQVASEKKLKVYFIGHPKNTTIEQTARLTSQKIPGINIVGWFDGYEINSNFEGAEEEIKEKKPDIILVGAGFPRQEQLMVRLTARVAHGVFIGEGGTFDYEQFGGKYRRAPVWMRRSGLEWLWRLILEPSRLPRQLAIPRFVWAIYSQGRRQPAKAARR